MMYLSLNEQEAAHLNSQQQEAYLSSLIKFPLCFKIRVLVTLDHYEIVSLWFDFYVGPGNFAKTLSPRPTSQESIIVKMHNVFLPSWIVR